MRSRHIRRNVVGALCLLSIVCSVGVGFPPAASAAPTVPVLDPFSLPICPPPAPLQSDLPAPKPLEDPSSPKCAYAPWTTGRTHVPGFADDKPMIVTEASFDAQAAAAGSTTQIHHVSFGPGQGNNGTLETAARGNRFGIFSSLYAQAPGLSGPADVYNWIGVQNNISGGNLSQVGIEYNNLPAAQECPNNVNGRPFILAEIEKDGVYGANLCYPNYVFGVGSHTSFETIFQAGYWQHWINWNGTWQLLVNTTVPHLTTSNAMATQSVEVIVKQFEAAPTFNINDGSVQLFDQAYTPHLWNSSYSAASVINNLTGIYCVSFPSAWSSMTVKNC